MSKVDVDEIQVGDLVEIYFEFEGEKSLGYVVNSYNDGIRVFYSDWLREDDVFFIDDNITGHWKVVNFEEESKMNDELKVYTGKEAIEILFEGKTLEEKISKQQYKLDDNNLLITTLNGEWIPSIFRFNELIGYEFTEVAVPQVGDWVRVNTKLGFTSTGLITNVASDRLYGNWNGDKGEMYYLNSDIKSWEILSPEQVSEYKRELAFSKVGRNLNEFKPEDIVYVESLEKVMIVISKINTDKVMLREINYTGSGRHAARPHQLKPICFAENQEDLS